MNEEKLKKSKDRLNDLEPEDYQIFYIKPL